MANAEQVMLYYLGGLGDGGFVSSRGATYPIPSRVGAPLEVPFYHVKALLQRYPSAFSVNPGDALKVDQEVQRKVALVNSLNDLPENLTKEQVVQLLQEFNFVPAESERSAETEGQTKARGRRAKVEEVVNGD